MVIRITVATALVGSLLATCLISGSAQATSVPVLEGDATSNIVTLIGRDGGGRGGGHASHGSGRGGGHASHGGGRGGGGYALRGGGGRHVYGGGGGKWSYGDRGGKRYSYKGGDHRYYDRDKRYYGGGKRYSYKGRDHGYYDRRKRYRRYGYYGWYGLPYIAYGDDCAWLYRRATATGSPYWWDRYYDCVGY